MLFLISLTVLLASVQGKFYEDCGSKLAAVESVRVSRCPEHAYGCVFKRKTDTLTIDFIPIVDVRTVKAQASFIHLNYTLPWTIQSNNTCVDNSINCPLMSTGKATYKTSLSVLSVYPPFPGKIKWELENEVGENLVCILISGRLK